MDDLTDLVQHMKLDTFFDEEDHIHYYPSDDEQLGEKVVREVWRDVESLAAGGFGEVWLQKLVSPGGEGNMRAVKVLSKRRTEARKINYEHELETIAMFSEGKHSRYFVELLGWYDDEENIYIAMEYLAFGDLSGYMDKHQPMHEGDARKVSHQLLAGISHMHRHGFAHRDIKPDNILIQSRPPYGTWLVKLSDFGISKRIDTAMQPPSSVKGSRPYLAHEVLWLERDSNVAIDWKAADMWSLGEVIHRMLTKKPVFPKNTLHRYLARNSPFPSQALSEWRVSENAVDFIKSIMQVEPESRLESQHSRGHRWFRPQEGGAQSVGSQTTSSSTTFAHFVDATLGAVQGYWEAGALGVLNKGNAYSSGLVQAVSHRPNHKCRKRWSAWGGWIWSTTHNRYYCQRQDTDGNIETRWGPVHNDD